MFGILVGYYGLVQTIDGDIEVNLPGDLLVLEINLLGALVYLDFSSHWGHVALAGGRLTAVRRNTIVYRDLGGLASKVDIRCIRNLILVGMTGVGLGNDIGPRRIGLLLKVRP